MLAQVQKPNMLPGKGPLPKSQLAGPSKIKDEAADDDTDTDSDSSSSSSSSAPKLKQKINKTLIATGVKATPKASTIKGGVVSGGSTVASSKPKRNASPTSGTTSFKSPLLSLPCLGKRQPRTLPSASPVALSQGQTAMTASLWTSGYPRTKIRKGAVPDEILREIDSVFASFKRYRKDIYFEQRGTQRKQGDRPMQLPVKLSDSAKKRILQGEASFVPAGGERDDGSSVMSASSGVGSANGGKEIAFRDPSLIVFKEIFCNIESGTVYQVNPGNKRVGVRSFKLFTCSVKNKRYLRNKSMMQRVPPQAGFRAAGQQAFEHPEPQEEDIIQIQANKLVDISRNGWVESQPFPWVPWELSNMTNIVDDFGPSKLWLLEGNTYGFKGAPVQLPLHEILRREKELERDEPPVLPLNQLLIPQLEDQQEGIIRSRSTKNQGLLKLTVRKLFDSKSRKVLLRFVSKVPTGESLNAGPTGLPISRVNHCLITKRNEKLIQQSSQGKLNSFNFIIGCTVVESGWIHIEDYVMRRNFDIVLPQKVHCVAVQPNPNSNAATKSSFLLTMSLGDYEENESQIVMMTVTREKSTKLDFCFFALEARLDFTLPLATGIDEEAKKRHESNTSGEFLNFTMFSPGSSPLSSNKLVPTPNYQEAGLAKNTTFGRPHLPELNPNSYQSPSRDRQQRNSAEPETRNKLVISQNSCTLSELSPLPILLHPLNPRTLLIVCDPTHSRADNKSHSPNHTPPNILILLLDTKTTNLELFQLIENNASRTAIFLTGPFKLHLLPSSPNSCPDTPSPEYTHPEIPSGPRVCILYAAETNGPFEDWSIGWARGVKQDAQGGYYSVCAIRNDTSVHPGVAGDRSAAEEGSGKGSPILQEPPPF